MNTLDKKAKWLSDFYAQAATMRMQNKVEGHGWLDNFYGPRFNDNPDNWRLIPPRVKGYIPRHVAEYWIKRTREEAERLHPTATDIIVVQELDE